MELSKRLSLIAKMVDRGCTVADIGTDHAYIPIYLVENNIVDRALALDINEGPLRIARENIKMYGLDEKIITRISDGLDRLDTGEADTIIIAGMGGELIIDILKRGKRFLQENKTFILSPHTKIGLVREFLMQNNMYVTCEKMCIDEGKYYTVIKAKTLVNSYMDEKELMFGPCLIREKDKVLISYLNREINKLNNILLIDEIGSERMGELLKMRDMIFEVLDEMC